MKVNASWILIFLFSLILIFIAWVYRERLSEFRSLGLLGIFLINFFGSATLFVPAPAIATVVVGGALYPPIAVALVSAVGSALGDSLGFLLGHSGRRALYSKKQPLWMKVTMKEFKRYGSLIIFVFALIPNPLFDFIGILAGMFSFSLFRFFILLLAGRLLRDILLAYLGHRLMLH